MSDTDRKRELDQHTIRELRAQVSTLTRRARSYEQRADAAEAALAEGQHRARVAEATNARVRDLALEGGQDAGAVRRRIIAVVAPDLYRITREVFSDA